MTRYDRADRIVGFIVLAAGLALIAFSLAAAVSQWRARAIPNPDLPSGIWTGLVDDLPSGRAVECVIVRDPSGPVAITCDWTTATYLPPTR